MENNYTLKTNFEKSETLIKDFHLSTIWWDYRVLNIKLSKRPGYPNKNLKAATEK